MKTRRFFALALSVIMLLSAMPMTALAADLPDNPAGTTVSVISMADTMPVNNGIVETNYGNIITNNGLVERNEANIRTNNGVVQTNNYTIGQNCGMVNHYRNTVDANNSGATVNNYGGKVGINQPGGTVNCYGGTVNINRSGGIVNNCGGSVENNNGTVNECCRIFFTGPGSTSIKADGLVDETNGNVWIVKATGSATLSPKAGYEFVTAPTAANCTITPAANGSYTVSGVTANTTVTVNVEANGTLGGELKFSNTTGVSFAGGVYTVSENGSYTVSMADGKTTTTNTIKVADGLTDVKLTLNGVTINTTAGSPLDCGTAKVNLTLEGTNNLTTSGNFAALRLPAGGTLTINGSGTLNATAEKGAGIGGDSGDYRTSKKFESCGTVTVSGGTVNAASQNGAGIGGGYGGSNTSEKGGDGGTISVTGGIVNATSQNGAGIGGGQGGTKSSATEIGGAGGNGGTVTITGGTVNAESQRGTGIGGGMGENGNGKRKKPSNGGAGGNGGILTVSGGTVNAKSEHGNGVGGARGGSGYDCDGGKGGSGCAITISGGFVTIINEFKKGINFGGQGGLGISGGANGADGASGSIVISPAAGTKIAVAAGTDSDSARELDASPFTAESGNIVGSVSESRYLSVETIDISTRLISTAQELYDFAAYVNAGNYYVNAKLTADITLSTGVLDANNNFIGTSLTAWTPIASNTSPYMGIFDGGGHTISGLYYNGGDNYSGMFRAIGDTAVIKNLELVDTAINPGSENGATCGALVGQSNGIIEKCFVNANVGGWGYLGGIAGRSYGTMKNCGANAWVFAHESGAGGLAGEISGSMENCFFIGTVGAGNGNAGALFFSKLTGAAVTSCYRPDGLPGADGTIRTAEEFASGKVAYELNGGKTDGSQVWYQTIGTDASPKFTGGTVYKIKSYVCPGNGSYTEIYSNNASDKHAAAHHYINGFCEHCDGYEPATLVGASNVASLGLNDGYIGYYAIANAGQLYWYADNGISSYSGVLVSDITVNTGNLFGYDGVSANSFRPWRRNLELNEVTFDGNGHSISGLYITGGGNAGVFALMVNNATVRNLILENSYIMGASGTNRAGGIAGNIAGGDIAGCEIRTTVVSNSGGVAGGIVGFIESGNVSRCSFSGTVIGINAGGIAGVSSTTSVNIVSCYVGEASLSGSSNCGAICGNNNGGTVTDCVYDSDTITGGAIGVNYGNATNVTGVKTTDFASGRATWLLNGGESQASPLRWYQTLGAGGDSMPTRDTGHDTVYQIKKYVCPENGDFSYGYSNTNTDTHGASHVFDREIATSDHFCSAATCTERARYYKSCACGENGSETFEYGEKLEHDFNELYTFKGDYHWRECKRQDCDETTPKEAHVWTAGEIKTPADYFQPGTQEYTCFCGATKLETIPRLIDSTAPTLTVSYENNGWHAFLNTVTFGLFFKDTATVKLSATDAGSGVKEFRYSLDGTNYTTITANASGEASFNIEPQWEGKITAIAVDNTGNESASAATEGFAVDSVAPTVSLAPEYPAGASAVYATEGGTDIYVYNSDLTIKAAVADSGSGIKSVSYTVNYLNDNGITALYDSGTMFTYAPPMNPTQADIVHAKDGNALSVTVPSLADNTRRILVTVSATDNSGNTSSATYAFYMDNTSPTIHASGDTATVKTSDAVSISATSGISGIKKIEVSRDGGDYTDITDTYTKGCTVTANGTYTFRVTNGLGITSTCDITYTSIDTAKPVVSVDAGGYVSGTWTNKDITLTASNTAPNLGAAAIEYKVNGAWQSYTSPITVNTDGDTSYTFRATSAAGIVGDEVQFTLKRDTAAPTGDVLIKNNSVKRLINAISFGLFFGESVDVEIISADNASSIASVLYTRSERILTEDELQTAVWTDYTEKLSETAADKEKFIYYVMLTDHAGNITVFGSDGAVFDLQKPVFSNAADGGVYYTTRIVSVSDENLDTLTLNGNPVTFPVTLEGNKAANVTLIAKDKAGNENTLTVTMKPVSELMGEIKNITKDTVELSDEDRLTKAKAELEKLFKDDTDSITDEETDEIENCISVIDGALSAIGNAQRVQSQIDALPAAEKISKSDTDAVNTAKKAYDVLTEHEKTLVDASGLNKALDTLRAPDEIPANIDRKPANSGEYPPKTGENSRIQLWIALLFISGGALAATTVFKKKRYYKNRF